MNFRERAQADYRPEIDGLRALAVVLVMFFHGNVPGFSAGYIGVDVFFVISGFLITGILHRELQEGRFSFARFYVRRARRILPALLLVLLVTSIAAWFVLSPADMKRHAQSLLASLAMVSNLYFWQSSGYFSVAAEFQPLLHTWSLSVEEQFYLCAPLLLWGLWRAGIRRSLPWLVLLSFCSLGLALLLGQSHPDAVFFLLPMRAWELALGACLAVHLQATPRPPISVPGREARVAGGLLLILLPLFLSAHYAAPPIVAALLACGGTLLILRHADSEGWMGRVFASQALVSLGLISYSAYLWHQPLFALYRQRPDWPEGPVPFILLAVCAFALAYPTWRWVEQPCRDAGRIPGRRLMAGLLLAAALLLAFGIAGQLTQGFAFRLTDQQARFVDQYENSRPGWRYFERIRATEVFRFQCNFYDVEAARAGRPTSVPRSKIAPECRERAQQAAPTVLLWGDSHAQQLYPGLRASIPQEWQVLQVTTSNCTPRLAESRDAPATQTYCEYSNAFVRGLLRDMRPDVVLIAQEKALSPEDALALIRGLQSTGVHRVVIMGPVPRWRIDLPALALPYLGSPQSVLATGFETGVFREDEALNKALSHQAGVAYVSALQFFCPAQACRLFVGSGSSPVPVAWDRAHLTPEASAELADAMLKPLFPAPPPHSAPDLPARLQF